MKYLIVTSDKPYFLWQMLIQYNNFKKHGIEKDIIWVYSYEKKPSEAIRQLSKHLNVYSCGYPDLRDKNGKEYPSSIRPYILNKFFNDNRKLSKETFFFTDPDVLFYKRFSTSRLLDNNTWYMSDTKSYLGVDYIKGKSVDLFNEMCEVVGIDPSLVEKNNDNVGGAQIIMKNLIPEYWEKVYIDSENLYKLMRDTSNKYSPEHPIQKWTADMWALLWNAWLLGNKTKTIKRMEFSWATSPMRKVENMVIFHNAGVTNKHTDLFDKTKFVNKHPFYENLDFVNKDIGSYYYVQELKDTYKNHKKLIDSYL